MRALATDPAARGLLDDAAVLPTTGVDLVLTHDMLVEGVHFLPTDPPEDVAWKLVAVNLSDLAGKGAKPRGVLLGYGLGDADWDARFVAGLASALAAMDVALLGGDTVIARGPKTLSLTAVGEASSMETPSRPGARADIGQAGDDLWVSGTIGDAGPGLVIAQGGLQGPAWLLERYRRPTPRTALGMAIAPHVHAMMDVSDGLLIDVSRLAAASGVAAILDLDALPLSPAFVEVAGTDRQARIAAATAGDDYELLFAAPAEARGAIDACARASGTPVARIGRVEPGDGLSLHDGDGPVPLPDRLGYEHGAS